jgi:hypothetical protein
MGKNAAKETRKYAGPFPIPNQRIDIGTNATGGMGRNISRRGLPYSLKRLLEAVKIPKPIPIIAAIVNPTKTLHMLIPASANN